MQIIFKIGLYFLIFLPYLALGQAKKVTKPATKQTTKKPAKPAPKPVPPPIGNVGLSVAYLTGRFNPAEDNRFVKISEKHTAAVRYMRREAYQAFVQMHEAAKKEGINLLIISATRTFEQQRQVWDAKWLGTRQVDGEMLPQNTPDSIRAIKILRWSAMPGTSRHHWGTDIDINSVEPKYWESGRGLKEYEWLQKNAHLYGFCQVYSPLGGKGNRQTGYQEEKWHWSYMPVAEKLLHWYVKMIRDTDLHGCEGAHTAPKIQILKKYVRGLNPNCK